MHDEWEFAQLARVGFGRSQPLLQARLVYILQAAGTVAWRQQRVVQIALAMTNATDVAAALRCLAAAGTEPDQTVSIQLG